MSRSKIVFDRIEIRDKNDFYRCPDDVKVISDYLEQHNVNFVSAEKVGIDMYKKWIDMLDSEYVIHNSKDRTIIIEDDMTIEILFFYINFVDEVRPCIDLEEEYIDGKRICYVNFDYWPTR